MMIKDKENRESKLGSEDTVVHRLIIDLDENDPDDNADGDDGDDKCSLVEDLIPAVQNLEIGPSHPLLATNPVSVPTKKTIEVILHNDGASRFNYPPDATEKDAKDAKAINGERSEAVSVAISVVTQKEEPGTNTPEPVASPLESSTPQATSNRDHRSGSKERSREPKSIRNRPKTSPQPDVVPTMPRHRELPREPRAMREQRNREQKYAIPKSSSGGESRRSKWDEKENESRGNVCKRN
ncbi:hypothetical protein P691DRAFT_357517 [Macrolepiota fuliginosa MF-IS2]|uniref:Uncharacterized protein n=1 Tax=Macrolepiota fuliginosa MF-IS2 TaxID=1400762 RepID=A0A9P5X4D6_9AGAR|nr:hypothetical protein P691DRAFT_357517 [Macrolepiota fuliginosa MF-IS2]